jgi:spermidine/putrescine transport system permease protein
MNQQRYKTLKICYLSMVYALLYIPIIVLIIFSFNTAKYSMVWRGFSLQWYDVLFQDTEIWRAVSHSIILGLTASMGATLLGALAAVSLFRFKFQGKNLLQGLIFILIVIPDIVMGISLLILFTRTNIPLGFLSLSLAHITFCLPFVVVTIYGRISHLDKNIFEAAIDLGANEWTILSKITLPLLLPAIIAAFLLSFTLSFDDVVISYFVSGPAFEILPLKIFSMARIGVKPELNALCAVVFILTISFVMISQRLLRKKSHA